MKLFNREVGPGEPVYVIADAGLCHDGRFENALTLIKAAARAGADCVKFQKRDMATIPDTPVDDPRFPDFDGTWRELRATHEFNMAEYEHLKQHAHAHGIDFLVTPFDVPSVHFLEALGVEAYKIANFKTDDKALVETVLDTGKPLIVSVGQLLDDDAQYWLIIYYTSDRDIDKIPAFLTESLGADYEPPDTLLPLVARQDVAFLHCVSQYPTPPEHTNIKRIKEIVGRWELSHRPEDNRQFIPRPIGYSGHEEGYAITLAAVALGACIVERHITLANRPTGFDHNVALDVDDFAAMVQGVREIEAALHAG